MFPELQILTVPKEVLEEDRETPVLSFLLDEQISAEVEERISSACRYPYL